MPGVCMCLGCEPGAARHVREPSSGQKRQILTREHPDPRVPRARGETTLTLYQVACWKR